MNIVITMAGKGQRFIDAGYKVPKYMIKVKGKTLFEWSMESLTDFNDDDVKYIFIVRKEDNSKDFIKNKMNEIGVNNIEVCEIDNLTDGQATSAMIASKYWKEDDELFIYNIDTYVEAGEMKKSAIKGDGFIPCFHAEGDHWSFVKLNSEGEAVEIREKKRISDNCTIGAYYFKTCNLYESLYNEFYKDSKNIEKGEKYIAPLYNFLIEKGGKVEISIIDSEKVHVLGTPDELEEFKNQK